MSVQRWSQTSRRWVVTDTGEWVRYDDHVAALAEAERRGRLAGLREGYAEGYDASLAAPRTLTRDGWWTFGSFVDYSFPLEFDGEAEDGLPIWERPDKSRVLPRTLTADSPKPAVGSVVLNPNGVAYELVNRHGGWQMVGDERIWTWADVTRFGPVTLIHDGGQA
jgi:hypothetical protein